MDGFAKPVAGPIREHMLQVTVPASGAVFAVANQAPQTAADWKVLNNSVQQLVTSANWLGKQTPKDNAAVWQQSLQTMRSALGQAQQAVKRKNVDALSDAGDVLYQACDVCHRQYLTQPGLPHP